MELSEIASSTGNDPELDALIIRLHLETACRRGGTLGLHVADLNVADCLIRLREKGGTVRWQPISPTLTRHLLDHVRTRGELETTTRLLRYRDGGPIGRHRFNYVTKRFRRHPALGPSLADQHPRRRRESRIGLTDRVLLFAAFDHDVLVVYSTSFLADALVAKLPQLWSAQL